jgi:hypothetical protein
LTISPVDPPGLTIPYDIYDPAIQLTVPPPAIAFEPSECVYDVLLTAKTFNGSGLPSFVQFDSTTGLEIFSANPFDFGTT